MSLDAPPRARFAGVDVARGVALVGMGVYHLGWDLATFRLAPAALPFTPGMRLLSHVVASAFLALVGVSLVLAHRDGLRPRAFAGRFALIVGAAALVSAASYAFEPDAPILFGILHCIAAASLLSLPFVGAPPALSVVAGVVAALAPFVFRSAAFNPPALLWFGLGTVEPRTLDWRPLLPYAGVTLIALGLTRWRLTRRRAPAAAPPRRLTPIPRGLALAGRHSLAVYLIHQPVLIALVWSAATLTGAGAGDDYADFIAACRRTCVAGGRAEAPCEAACACVAEVFRHSGEARALASGALGEEEKARLKALADACYAP